jgi:hypothetical protein
MMENLPSIKVKRLKPVRVLGLIAGQQNQSQAND